MCSWLTLYRYPENKFTKCSCELKFATSKTREKKGWIDRCGLAQKTRRITECSIHTHASQTGVSAKSIRNSGRGHSWVKKCETLTPSTRRRFGTELLRSPSMKHGKRWRHGGKKALKVKWKSETSSNGFVGTLHCTEATDSAPLFLLNMPEVGFDKRKFLDSYHPSPSARRSVPKFCRARTELSLYWTSCKGA